MLKNLAFIIGGFYLLKTLASSAGAAIQDRIQIGTPRASGFSVGIAGANFTLTIPLTNNLTIPLPSNSFAGKLLFEGIEVGTVSYPTIDVAAGQSVDIATNVSLDLSSIPNLVQIVLDNPSTLFNGLIIKGQFTSNGVPVNYESNITL